MPPTPLRLWGKTAIDGVVHGLECLLMEFLELFHPWPLEQTKPSPNPSQPPEPLNSYPAGRVHVLDDQTTLSSCILPRNDEGFLFLSSLKIEVPRFRKL